MPLLAFSRFIRLTPLLIKEGSSRSALSLFACSLLWIGWIRGTPVLKVVVPPLESCCFGHSESFEFYHSASVKVYSTILLPPFYRRNSSITRPVSVFVRGLPDGIFALANASAVGAGTDASFNRLTEGHASSS